MPKQGEIDYLDAIGPVAAAHAAAKPFSDPNCGRYLMDLGLVLALLPPPPARVLDLGVGTGWTSLLLARRGYEVTGQDIAPAMIDLAQANQIEAGLHSVRFLASDYEHLPFFAEFDAALFYDSLHHAENERLALAGVWRALKPGGICLTIEPGAGHAAGSRQVAERYQVTEKDMPPGHIMEIGRAVGFREAQVFARPGIVPQDIAGGWCRNLVKGVRALAREWLGRPRRQALWESQVVVLRK